MTERARFLPDVTVEQYRQPSGEPRLSQSIGKLLCEASPWHAKQALDRQTPEPEGEEDEGEEEPEAPGRGQTALDRGTIIHAYMLGTAAPFIVAADDNGVPFRDFRTKAAKEQKAAIRAKGKIPMIAGKADAILRQGERLRVNLYHEHGINLTGRSELAVEWGEVASNREAVPCRGMLDHWMPDTFTIYDLKIWASANPAHLPRKIVDMGLDIQAEAYTRAVERVHPELAGRVRFVALIGEASTGLVTPIELDGTARQLGRMRWRRSIDLWARCMAADDWPGYARGVLTVGVPDYQIAAEMIRSQDSDELAAYLPAAHRHESENNDHGE